MTLRHGAAALLLASMIVGLTSATGAAAQDDRPPGTPEESRALLEQSCRDEGMAEETCVCLGDFVTSNFSERELAGAAMVFSNPLYTADPAAGIGALLSAGYTLEEITAVADRVMSLEQAAKTTCAVEDAPAADAEPEAE